NVFLSFRRINHPSLRLPWKSCSSGQPQGLCGMGLSFSCPTEEQAHRWVLSWWTPKLLLFARMTQLILLASFSCRKIHTKRHQDL
uniref:Uncharacterized protein n=1 Tax=Cairina moschata TaxID=8855 RepID=A0A8C3D4V4_CAIMO